MLTRSNIQLEIININMTRKNKIRIYIGTLLSIIGVISWLTNISNTFSSAFMFNAGLVMFATGILRHMKYGAGPEFDERSKKISYTALAASFQITLMSLIGFWWVNYINPLSISLNSFINILVLWMILLAGIFNIYYSKKGTDI